MRHASVELIAAMYGVEPFGGPHRDIEGAHLADFRCACGEKGAYVLACAEWPELSNAAETIEVVDCPACLCLMRDAIPPVRWDALEERGLAPKLPLVSQEAKP